MNRVASHVLPSLLLLGALTACDAAAQSQSTPTTAVPTTTASPTTTTVAKPTGPPAVPEPTVDGACPYLDTKFVQEANGQLVRKVRLSADQPHPACFFYANATDVQLSVWVYQGEVKIAKAIVDRAAPIADSSPATVPEGWSGGSVSNADGAVYAVAKLGNAVVVTSNQQQSIKARRIAETVVGNLQLGY
jgi:hypothetical protein